MGRKRKGSDLRVSCRVVRRDETLKEGAAYDGTDCRVVASQVGRGREPITGAPIRAFKKVRVWEGTGATDVDDG